MAVFVVSQDLYKHTRSGISRRVESKARRFDIANPFIEEMGSQGEGNNTHAKNNNNRGTVTKRCGISSGGNVLPPPPSLLGRGSEILLFLAEQVG